MRSGGLDRRAVLAVGSLGTFTLPQLLYAARVDQAASTHRPRAKSCVLLYMDGGPSQLDLFDLKPQAPLEIRGPFQPIATSVSGLHVSELLPHTASVMHHIMQIRSVQHEQMVHDPAVYETLTGYPHISSAGGLKVEATDLPHVGCAVARTDNYPTSLPRHIQVPDMMKMEARVLPGQNAGVLGASFDPFSVFISHQGEIQRPEFRRSTDVSIRRQAERAALLNSVNLRVSHTAATDRFGDFQQQAIDILSRNAMDRAFDLDSEPDSVQERYGRYRHGRCVLLARRMVEAGARFVTVYWGNEDQDWADGRGARPANNPWDTHRNHFPLTRDSLAPRADKTLAAFLSDLAERGLLEETLVVWMGEFGRTPRISKPWASRDHWPHAFTILVAGAGVRGGAVFGQTDAHGASVMDSPVSPADVTATVIAALGLEPETLVETAGGRPHRLSTGRPIDRLWS